MKKYLILSCALMLLSLQSALADITFTVSPASQGPITAGDTFTVDVRLDITQNTAPANIAGFDLIFEAFAMQNSININNLFSLTAASTPISGWSLIGFLPSLLTTSGSDHSSFVQNDSNMGFSAGNPATQNIDTPVTNLLIGTYTFTVNASTPAGVYTFDTTQSGTSPGKFSDVSDASGAIFAANNSSSFNITVVPEPSTWSLVVLGSLGCLGLGLLRRTRRV